MNTHSGPEVLLHASCVAIDGRAVLISGPSGAGKSDLALRLIDRGATLVADDCTLVRCTEGVLIARSPDTIAGQIEVRGIGIVHFTHCDDVPVALVATISKAVDRMPQPDASRDIAGIPIPAIGIAAHEASAPIKIELAVRHLAAQKGS